MMNSNLDNKVVVCFGEILWDVLPSGKTAGGAPMNVAYHLQKMGIESKMVSRVGDDVPGKNLLEFLEGNDLSTQFIQFDKTKDTSEVHAVIGENDEVAYDIIYPVAWDYIQWLPEHEDLLKNADAFVFGSLGVRNNVSKETLLKMLEYTGYCVFDINLRAPHFSAELIAGLLPKSHLVKLNVHELMMMAEWFDPSCTTESACVNMMFERFKIQELLVTNGSKGASYYTADKQYDAAAHPVKVKDTIGSGDSFLAAFLAVKLTGGSPEDALKYAVGMGGFITSKSGACPAYEKGDLDLFIASQERAD